MKRTRVGSWSVTIAIALCAVAFLFPGVAYAFGTVTGDVVNDAAVGIEGIKVVPLTLVDGQWNELWGLSATTDPIGGYTLTLPFGEYWIRFIDTDGRVTGTLGEKYYAYEYYPDANWADAGDPVLVEEGLTTDLGSQTLSEGATISGAVFTEAGGVPLANIHAVAHVQFGGGFPGVIEDVTDDTGAYTIVGLPPGEYAVRFEDQSYAYAAEFYNDQPEWRVDLAEKFWLNDPTSSVTGVNAALAPGCGISGTITDGTNPLPGSTVWVMAYNGDGDYWMWVKQATALGDGSYECAGLRAGVYRLMVEGPDGSWASECYNDKPASPSAGDDIFLGGAEPTAKTIDVALAPAGYIEGWVLQEGSGDPIADSPVNACIDRDGWFEAVAWTDTDYAGKFILERLAAGSYYVQFNGGDGWIGELYDNQRDWSMATPVSVTAGFTTTLADAYLTMGASIEGYVYAPDGVTPLAGIAVTPFRRIGGDMGHEERGDLTYFTDSDPMGHFRIEGLEPGEWALKIYDFTGTYAAQFQDGQLIPSLAYFSTIASGDTWTPPNIVLSEAGSIVGTVYDDGEPGTPLEGITVAAWLPIGGGYEWIVSDQTDGSGEYELIGVKPGDVYLEFQGNTSWLGEYWSTDPVGGTRDRLLADAVTVMAGLAAGPFDAHLDPAASVSGYVTTGGGLTKLGGITVVPMQLESNEWDTWWNHRWDLSARTQGAEGDEGYFQIGGLTPGTWTLMYTDQDGVYATEYFSERSLQSEADQFEVTEGGPVAGNFDVDLEQGAFIVGTVTGNGEEPEPTPLHGIGVNINVDRGDWLESIAWANTGVDGQYGTFGLKPGSYIVEFYGDQDWQGEFYSVEFPDTRDWTQATPVTVTAGETAVADATLQPAASVAGQVSTFDGTDTKHGEGIDVMLLTYNEGADRWEYRWDLWDTTDENGFYRIGGLEFGDYRVMFQDPSGQWATEFYDDANSPRDATTVGVTSGNWVADAQLVPGNTITGTVTGLVEASGLVEPLGNITVAAGPYGEDGYYEHIAWATTSSEAPVGTFELRGLPAGSFKVEFWDDAGRYTREYFNDTQDWWEATPVVFAGEGASQDLGTVELGVAASVTGHVTDGLADLDGISVVPCYWEDDGGGGVWLNERWDLSRQTADGGMFTLTGLTPSAVADTVIMFQDPNGVYAKQYYNGAAAPGDATKVALDPGPNDLGDITLGLANRISGWVTADGTTGLGGISVAAGPYDPDTGRYDHVAWAETSAADDETKGTYDLVGLPPGSYVVQFWDANGMLIDQFYSTSAPGTRDIEEATPVVFAGFGETKTGVDAQMLPGSVVKGVVTEDDGITGVANIDVVPVIWQSDGGTDGWWDAQWHRSTRTYGGGEFILAGFEPGETMRLLFQDPSGDWAYEYYNNAVTPDGGQDIGPLAPGENMIDPVALVRANHITGTVDSADGLLGDISVAAGIYDRTTGYYEHVSWTMTSAEPGMEGTYDLGGLPAGSYIVEFRDDLGNYGMKYYDGTPQGTTDWNASLPVDFAGSGSTASGVDAFLDPAAYVSGTVYGDDGSGPKALGNIDVQLYTFNGEWWDNSGWAQTQEDGTYRIGGLADGTVCRLLFSDWTGTWAAEAYADASSWQWGDEVTTTIATPAEGKDVTLSPAGSITGVVMGGGAPLPGAPVSAGAYNTETDQWDQYFFDETDDQGRYTFTGLKPGVAYRVQAGDYSGTYTWTMWTADGTGDGDWHTGDDVFVLAPPATPTVCDFDLSVGGSIKGHVENASGQPLKDTWVMLFAPSGEGWDDWWASWQGVQGSTDVNGDFRVGGLYPGDYRIAIVPGDNTGGYAGEYYDDQPLLSMGTTITISAPGEELVLPNDIVLSVAGTIEGTVYDDGDPAKPLEGMEVRAAVQTDGAGGWRMLEGEFGTTDVNGHYSIPNIRPDDAVRVFASDPNGWYVDEWWQEAPGFEGATPVNAPQTGIDFTLAKGGRISGTITLDPAGTYETIGVRIYKAVGSGEDWHLEPVQEVRGQWGGISETGNFESGPLPPDTYYVGYYDESGLYASEFYASELLPSWATPVNVVAGDSVTADATLTRAASISGHVYDDGDPALPLAGIEVRALMWDTYLGRWEPVGTQVATTDATGEYFLVAPTGVSFIVEFRDPTDEFVTQYYQGVFKPDDARRFVNLTPGDEWAGINALMLHPDSEAPTAGISVDPATPDGAEGWYVNAPSITLTTDDPTATLWYEWGSYEFFEYSEPIEPPAGMATLAYWARDPMGNESGHATYDFKYDPLPPDAPLTLTADQTGPAEVTVQWGPSYDEDSGLSHYELWTSTDGSTWSLEDGAVTAEVYLLGSLPSGGLYVKVRAVDVAGNTSLYSPSDYVVVDADKPVTTAIVAPATPDGENGWYVTKPTITLTCDDPAATVFFTFAPPWEFEYTDPLEAPLGSSTMSYWAVDEWSNAEAVHTLDLKVDPFAPAAPTGLSAAATGQSTVGLEWTASFFDTEGNVDHSGISEYEVYRDGSYVGWTTWNTYTATGLSPDTLYEFTVVAVDGAGNTSAASAAASATTDADTTAPTTTINVTGGTTGQNGWYTAAPTITLTSSESGTTWYQWGSEAAVEYSVGFQPPVGENVLTYWSVDDYSNIEDPKLTRTFKLDTTAPTTPGDFTAERSGANSVTLTWSASADAQSGLSMYVYTQTGPQSGSGAIGAASTSYTIPSLPDGTYTFSLVARNNAGLVSASTATITVAIDTTAPVTTMVTDPIVPNGVGGWFKVTPSITLGSTAADLKWIVYRWGDGAETTYTAPIQPAEGTSTLWWRGADESGNVEEWKSQEFKVDSVPPAAPTGLIGVATGQTTASLSWNAVTGDTSGIAYYRVYEGHDVLGDVTTTSFSVTGLAPGSTHVLTVRAYDNAGNESVISAGASVTTEAPMFYTVTFKDWDGTILKTEEVAEGSAATAPATPTRTGWTFAGWDAAFTSVTSNLTVTATYTYDGVVWETIGGVDYARVAGAARFDTAAQAALDAFPAGATTAIIAYGRDFPDALAASPLAGAVDGPILLTETASLPAITAGTLTDLGVTKVYIVGGTGVVSPAVVTALNGLGITDIERLAGDNRYITARMIADEAVALGASTTDAFLVRGDAFADALAISSIAAQEQIPVLLTTTATLHAQAQSFLTTTGTDHVYIAGGTGVVSPAVQAAVDALAGTDVTRWSGDNRYQTGAAVIRGAMSTWSIPMVDIGLASGEDFPDALAGGAVMGYRGGLLLLTQPSVLSAPTATLITENKATIDSVEFFGGTGPLSPAIPTTVKQLLQ